MKKKIEQLLNGKFEYDQPPLLFSQEKISLTLKAGEIRKGELYVGTDDNEKIRGYVTSSSRRVVPGIDKFSGTTVCLPYGIDCTGLGPGESVKGWLCFTTNIGEYKLPFDIQVEKEQIRSSVGEVKDMDTFRDIAKKDFREAYHIFTDKSFSMILRDKGHKEHALYAGMSQQPVTYQHLEEFFIGAGEKEKITVSLKTPGAKFYEVRESIQESFAVQRSGWGHLRLDIETRGSFLEVGKRVVTEEDFIGSSYQVDFVIHKDKLGSGNQFGQILVKSPYQELVYQITASKSSKVQVNMNIGEKQHKLTLVRDYLDYCCNKMDFKTWAGSSHFELNQLWESGCDYPEYQMYEAYLLHLEENDEAASEILRKYQDKSFSKDDLEFAGVYLYLCTLTGLYKDKAQALRRIQNFYMQKEDSFQLFWILLKTDPAVTSSPSKAVFMMEEQFERGCRSPLLYLEAWKYICKDMSLLHRLSSFWAQVFLFAGKEGLLTEELSMRFAYLSGYEKSFNQSLYRAMTMGYEVFPSEDTLEAICKYIMKGNPRRNEYFRWFSLAVEHGLRLTRLFEYYVETLDTTYQRELPKPLLMYFTYNSTTLGDAKKAYIYASVISNRAQEPQTYESYKESMQTFAAQKLAEGRMNESYAAIYQEFLSNPATTEEAEAVARRMFTCRLYCDDKKIRHIIVRHDQMEREEIYPCVQGVAYPRIYTEDAVILFQDEKQRRYAATVDFNVKKLMDEREMVPAVLKAGTAEPGVLLHYCESVSLDRDNLEIFQKLVKSDAFTENYKSQVRKKILDYYASHVHGEDLDDYLKKMDFREYAMVDRETLLETLITRGLFTQALGIIEEFGFEGLEMGSLLKLTSRMIIRCEMAEDEELLALASEVYRSGKYDEVILQYLMKYRFGPVDEIFSIWKSARGFEMDTYDLEERLLGLLMFTSDFRKEGENVLDAYVKQSGKERIIGAYLTQVAYGVFVREFPMSAFVRECLEHAFTRKWPVNLVCRLALLKALSKEKDSKGVYLDMKKELLEECTKQGMAFAFFRKLPPELLSPYQLDDKTYVEFHASPKARVTLYYSLDTGLGLEAEYKSEPLRNIYEGIFTKTFTLFYGETLHYYFQVDENGKSRKIAERVITMNKVEGAPVSKYQLINQILSARRLEKDQEVIAKMKQYLRQEQYVKEMFVIEREV
ncbi:DUF5717 family protein [Blautia schinkii]|nr:DUF5717 family protein [Blautia schinkii]